MFFEQYLRQHLVLLPSDETEDDVWRTNVDAWKYVCFYFHPKRNTALGPVDHLDSMNRGSSTGVTLKIHKIHFPAFKLTSKCQKALLIGRFWIHGRYHRFKCRKTSSIDTASNIKNIQSRFSPECRSESRSARRRFQSRLGSSFCW